MPFTVAPSTAFWKSTSRLTTAAVSRPYLDMTAAVMRSFGADVSDDDGTAWTVSGGYTAPGDYENVRITDIQVFAPGQFDSAKVAMTVKVQMSPENDPTR